MCAWIYVCALHLESRVLYQTNVNKKGTNSIHIQGRMKTVIRSETHEQKQRMTLCAYQFSSSQTELDPSTANIDTKCFPNGSFSGALHQSEISGNFVEKNMENN